jgi:predicted amidohydrolase
MSLRVALAQCDTVLGNVSANLDRALSTIDSAQFNADLLVFPELSLSGYSLTDVTRVGLRLDGPELSTLAAASRGVAVAVGFVEETPDARWYNSAAVFAEGRLLHLHRKVYPPTYGCFEEGKHFGRGTSIRCFDLLGWRIGLMICADWWHPSVPYLMAADGADLLIAMAASPQGGLGEDYDSSEGWFRLNRTYASIYGTYVAFCNRTGIEGGTRFWGKSELVDPYGQPMAQAGPGEELITAALDRERVRTMRYMLPTMRDEDLDLTSRTLHRLIQERETHTAFTTPRRAQGGSENERPWPHGPAA